MMDFRFTEEQDNFRQEIRTFLKTELPPDWVDYSPVTSADHVNHDENGWEVFEDIAHKLGERGWLSLFWPKEYGGQERSYVENFILREELARRGSPGYNAVATRMLAPTLMKYGTEEQKITHLKPIASGKIFWCECFSEPEAGSDIANIKTKATADKEYYIINGQKTWCTFANYADWCFIMARSDPESTRHRGLTVFLVDLSTPGITINPIENMAGEPHFCELFFDDVKVPAENILGNAGEGWQVAQTLLSFERGSIEFPPRVVSLIERLKHIEVVKNNINHRNTLAELAIEAEVGRLLNYRIAWMHDNGITTEWHAAMAKLYSTELYKHAGAIALELLGMYGQLDRKDILAPLHGWFENYYITSFGATIAAGTSEIQRTIIALRGLGMPRS
jgi:alkylation response protein AidB-like acyl-CoA dehydrogenase